ncbi:hypothetical protein AMD27_06350 [Acinetobacter sp. TGL-Y2]|uniref:hypothetical protein n=1 Tax=Acinetobacter sp. TGL-Y2 TaxID=1407071 RepID=UPI0007A645DF|nr:hypothetical protein [Acinetobacter sp. TGL-Y2]AMW78539.1 hypothetical protein AMD27_06350 [Acinetobacter sp. TGL-Y2]
MVSKYVLYPIQTVKDWQGEDWDIYEERKIVVGLTLQFGWRYGAPRLGSKSLVITPELADYIKTLTWLEMTDVLGISTSTATKIRCELNLQKAVSRRNYKWIIQHQHEILNYSYPMLFEKYGLSKGTVKSYSNYLVSELSIKDKKTRIHENQYTVEKIYQTHKVQIAQCKSFKELQKILQTDDYTARKFHELACAELQLPAMSEIHLKQLNATWQWRYQHRDTILNPDITILQIAAQLNTSTDQIYNARKALRRRLNIKEIIGVVGIEKWVLQHATELTTFKISELQKKYQMTKGQIKYRRMLLKRLQQNET